MSADNRDLESQTSDGGDRRHFAQVLDRICGYAAFVYRIATYALLERLGRRTCGRFWRIAYAPMTEKTDVKVYAGVVSLIRCGITV